MSGQFNFEMVLRMQAAQAKQELEAAKRALDDIAAAGKRGQAGAKEAAAGLDAAAAAAERAAAVQARLAEEEARYDLQRQRATGMIRDGSTPHNVLSQGNRALGQRAEIAVLRSTTGATNELRAAVSGANREIADQSAAWGRAIAEGREYREILDQVRAQYNPLFAASREYEHALERIAAAEELGAISAREAADARARAAARMMPVGGKAMPGTGAVFSHHTSNITAQFNDIGMMTLAGQNPMMLALQQGTQLGEVMMQVQAKGGGLFKALSAGFMSVLSPVNLLTIGVIGLGAAGVQALIRLVPEAKTLEEAISSLRSATDSYNKSLSESRRSLADLRGDFGASAAEARRLLTDLAALDELQRMGAFRDASKGLLDEMPGGQKLGLRSYSDRMGTLQRAFGEANWFRTGFISDASTPHSTAVMDALTGLQGAAKSDDLAQQIEAVKTLETALEAAANLSGDISEQEAGWLRTVKEMLLDLEQVQAARDNAVGAGQIEQLIAAQRQRIDMAAEILETGEDSAAVRALEITQARQLIGLELERAGVEQNSDLAREAMAQATLEVKQKHQAADKARQEAMDKLLVGQGQRIALADQELRYGKDSAEVRALEIRQARDLMAEELEQAGVKRTSVIGLIALSRAEYEAKQKHMAADRARQNAFDQYIRSQDDQIAGLRREGQLLGASNAERIMATALAEAEAEIRDRGREKALTAEEQALVRAKARVRAETEISNERERALRAIRLEAVSDQFDRRIALARDPVSQAQLEAQKEYQAQIGKGAGMMAAYASAMLAYNRTLDGAVTGGRVQIATIMDELAAREAVSRQVAAGLIPAGEAEALMRQELELRPLIAAAARAEGEEKRQLTEVVQGLRLAYALQADARRQQQAADYLRNQGETLRNLQLELALLGQTEATRGRVLAMAEAERQIRAAGIDSQGALAGQMRETARTIEAQTRALQAQAAAWGDIRSAAESAIDGTVDALLKGDIPGALSGIVNEITGIFAELAIKNPLKNAILGTDYATMDSLGGWQGILGRLLGNDPINEGALIDQGARPVQSMMITAGSVTIQAGNLDLGGMAANLIGAPGTGTLSGSTGIQKQIWDFFLGKGLAPHHVAGILGNVQGESRFNPLAQGDKINGQFTSFGLFQHHAGRGQGLLDYVGGIGNLTNVQAQLEYVWQELVTTERAALERLRATGTPAEAADAWMRGFERPSDAAIATSGPERAASAEAAMAQLGQGATNAAAGLDVLGQGAGSAGDGLTRLLQGLLTGGKEGLGGSLLSFGLDILANGLGSFAVGGPTGGNNPARVAGLVHEEEFVFDAAATKRIGVENLEALRRGRLRGYAAGGWVSPVPVMPMAAANAVTAPASAEPAMNVRMSFDLRGAAGDQKIEALVSKAVHEGWKEIARKELPGKVKKIVADPRRSG